MKTLYIDCSMGAAGDMLTAALLELLPDPKNFIDRINALGIPYVTVSHESIIKHGICGSHISVKIRGREEHTADDSHDYSHAHPHHHPCEQFSDKEHHHHKFQDIKHLIGRLPLSEKVQQDILNVYTLIAEAESKVHSTAVDQIHFHEVGNLDAITDITAVCMLMEEISPDEIVVSPIHVGSGHVHCAHGILPVPAPAAAEILRGVPIYSEHIKGELCTPTGAALLKHFASRFAAMPVMTLDTIGYGMGKKDFERLNCVRAILGHTPDQTDEMYELSCNVDDMTAEKIGYALEQFFKDGAVEAYTIPIGMKKSRPGTLISVICQKELKDTLIHTMFKHTSTCGIRVSIIQRSTLEREIIPVETRYGTVHRKNYWGYGIKRSKYEYEDLVRIANENQMSIDDVLDVL